MADFAAVLKRTIDGLKENTPEMRAKVYEHARVTIEAKLAAVTPPPPAALADRQRQHLEDAITAVEAGYMPARADEVDRDAELDRILADLDPTTATTGLGATLERLGTEYRNRPTKPAIATGPRFNLKAGKLSISPSRPREGEPARQQALHRQVRSAVKGCLADATKLENRFPELVRTVHEYATILDADPEEIDVTSLWAIGGALLSFGEAYKEQNTDRTLSEPIEPALAAQLGNISRLHGAFVMGFAEGRDLVERADEFLSDRKALAAAADNGDDLLRLLSTDSDLVDARTREMNRPILDSVTEFGWATSRTGYAAYLVVRNGITALIDLSLGSDKSLAKVAGALVAGGALIGAPNVEILNQAIRVFALYGQQIVAFFNHSPELRAYAEWAMHMLKVDDEVSRDG